MGDSRPSKGSTYAILTHLLVTKQQSVGADQSIVMERLNDRHAGSPTCGVNRRGKQRKEIVDMNDIGPKAVNLIGHAPPPSNRIRNLERSPYTREQAIDLAIVRLQKLDIMSVASQQVSLSSHDGILAACLLIAVMQLEDSH
jgi:hypothetical protein